MPHDFQETNCVASPSVMGGEGRRGEGKGREGRGMVGGMGALAAMGHSPLKIQNFF